MAKLRQQIPAVVEALQKTQQRYKRNFDSNVDTRNKRVRVGDYVYTTNHQQKNKLQSRTVGPFVVLDADDSTYVVDVNGEELSLSEWHGPYTYVWPCPPSLQGKDAPPAPVTQGVGSEPNGLLLPSVHDLTTTVEDLMYQSTEATLIAPRWESAPWYADAKSACASHEVLPHSSKDQNDMTTWALVAFHFNQTTHSATEANPSLSNDSTP